jgi:hypothetical protein
MMRRKTRAHHIISTKAISTGISTRKVKEKLQDVYIDMIKQERYRQDFKWGECDHDPALWLAIIGEEYGELCKAYLEGNKEGLEVEAIQVAACCVAMLENLHRTGE